MREERRESPRLSICVEVGAKHGDLPPIKAKSLDVSSGGIRLLLPEDLPIGNTLELQMNLPFPLVLARGEVVWKKESQAETGRLFQTGVQVSDSFIQVNYAKIKGFVQDMVHSKKTPLN